MSQQDEFEQMARVREQDRIDLAYWFPLIHAAGLPVPETYLLRTDAALMGVLDGEIPEGWDALAYDIRAAGDRLGWPCFLRTGHGSDKHSWARTCYVESASEVERHMVALIEWSALVDLAGLPTSTWAVRRMIQTAPLFRCPLFGGFPVTREFRFFVRDGVVEHVQPYWPPDAVEAGMPDRPEWRELLRDASALCPPERERLTALAVRACEAVGGGHWSVDLLEDSAGAWWLTDVALGDFSFRWDPAS